MYLQHFGLRQKPFLITPDPEFLYPSASHQQALGHLQYGLQREGGFLLLSGEVGTGKTTLCRRFMAALPAEVRLSYILNAQLDSRGVLAGICRELGLEVAADADSRTLVECLHDDLLRAHADNRKTLVIIEEAQNLSPEVLETLRLLTNLETVTTKLLHILLIGQPELLDILRQPSLRQLNQRVVARSHLGPLQRQELAPYLRHRLTCAGGDGELFGAGAVARLWRATGGVPRLVNLLAEHCLLGAYASGKGRITADIVARAAVELALHGSRAPRPRAWRRPALAAGLLLGLAGGVYLGVVAQGPASAWLAGKSWWSSQARSESAIEVAPVGSLTAPVAADVSASGDDPPLQRAVAAVSAPAANAFSRLLHRWQIEATPASLAELCDIAAAHELACVTWPVASPAQLRALNRPLLLRLADGQDGLRYHLVDRLQGAHLHLQSTAGELQLDVEQVLAQVEGEATLLWRPPAGFRQPVRPGDRNPVLLPLVSELLHAAGYLPGQLLTGGVYNDYLAQQVRRFQGAAGLAVDGILGQRTLLRLLEWRTGEPLLQDRES